MNGKVNCPRQRFQHGGSHGRRLSMLQNRGIKNQVPWYLQEYRPSWYGLRQDQAPFVVAVVFPFQVRMDFYAVLRRPLRQGAHISKGKDYGRSATAPQEDCEEGQ